MVFDIERFAIHDGYGIRTLVFMKGCPLSCVWCSNPESQKMQPEIMLYPEKCISCGKCIEDCPYGEDLKDSWPETRGLCVGCGDCTARCYAEARVLVGREMTLDEVFYEVSRDTAFYQSSGGGVTVGGGEPTMQHEFVAALLGRCREAGIHTAIETCSFVKWENYEKVLRNVDLLLADLKHTDSEKHKKFTGVGNEIILANLKKAAGAVPEMIVRFPLIPGFNDDLETVRSVGRFVSEELDGVDRLDIMPYHSLGQKKSERLGREYGMRSDFIDREDVEIVRSVLNEFDLKVSVGG